MVNLLSSSKETRSAEVKSSKPHKTYLPRYMLPIPVIGRIIDASLKEERKDFTFVAFITLTAKTLSVGLPLGHALALSEVPLITPGNEILIVFLEKLKKVEDGTRDCKILLLFDDDDDVLSPNCCWR